MKIGTLIFCLFILDACRGAPRAPVPKNNQERKEEANNTAPENDPCAKYQYGICPSGVDQDENSGETRVADPSRDLSEPIVKANFDFQKATAPVVINVTSDRQKIDEADIQLSELIIDPDDHLDDQLSSDGTPYNLSLQISAKVSKNNTDYCATGQLTADNLDNSKILKELEVVEGVCQ